jgi:hypothetical protein
MLHSAMFTDQQLQTIETAIAEIKRFSDEDDDSRTWGGPTIPPEPLKTWTVHAGLAAVRVALKEGQQTVMNAEPTIWVSEKFAHLQPVRKLIGYKFDGVVVSSFTTTAGKIRLVVENGDGLLHIFNEDQMATRSLEPETVTIPVEPQYGYIRAMSESEAVDAEGPFGPMCDLLGFSGENKTHTVLIAAYEAIVRLAKSRG